MRKSKWIIAIMMMVMMFSVIGCTGSVVPAGKIVVVKGTDGETEIVSSGLYRAIGRDRAYFIDSKIKSFSEPMNILCADDINMKVDVKTIAFFNIKKTDQKLIEYVITKIPATKIVKGETSGYEISLDSFYKLALKDIIRANSREIISQLKTDNIRVKRKQLQAAIEKIVKSEVKNNNYPIKISKILISNIDYPKEVTNQRMAIKRIELEEIKRDAIAKANLAEARRNVEVEIEMAKVRILKAKTTSKENKIIASSLTNSYLKYLEVQYMTTLSNNKNKDLVFVPYGSNNPGIYHK